MDLRKQRTFKLLSESLLGLMNTQPYDKISVSDICEGAMVRRATFYRHFAGKDELLRYVVSAKRSQIDAEVDPDGSLALADYCRAMTEALFSMVGEASGIIQMNRLSASFNTTVSLVASEIGAGFSQKLSSHAGAALSEGEARWLGSFYASGLMGAMVSFIQDPNGSTEEEFLKVLHASAERLFSF